MSFRAELTTSNCLLFKYIYKPRPGTQRENLSEILINVAFQSSLLKFLRLFSGRFKRHLCSLTGLICSDSLAEDFSRRNFQRTEAYFTYNLNILGAIGFPPFSGGLDGIFLLYTIRMTVLGLYIRLTVCFSFFGYNQSEQYFVAVAKFLSEAPVFLIFLAG